MPQGEVNSPHGGLNRLVRRSSQSEGGRRNPLHRVHHQ